MTDATPIAITLPDGDVRQMPLGELRHVRGYSHSAGPLLFLNCHACGTCFEVDTRTDVLSAAPWPDDHLGALCVACGASAPELVGLLNTAPTGQPGESFIPLLAAREILGVTRYAPPFLHYVCQECEEPGKVDTTAELLLVEVGPHATRAFCFRCSGQRGRKLSG